MDVKQYAVYLMNSAGIICRLFNVVSATAAVVIATSMYDGYRVIDVKENV